MLQLLHEVDDGLRCARLALVALHVIGEAAHARRGMIVDEEMGGAACPWCVAIYIRVYTTVDCSSIGGFIQVGFASPRRYPPPFGLGYPGELSRITLFWACAGAFEG